MLILKFSPEAIFINVISGLINSYKEKFGKKAKIKVKAEDSKKINK